MIRRLMDSTRPGTMPGPVNREDIYPRLDFPRGVVTGMRDDGTARRRPYTAINMVTTLDGKAVIGGPGTTSLIGGPTDHYLMARIDAQADAVLFGAGLVRDDDPPYPRLNTQEEDERERFGVRRKVLWGVVSTRGEFPRRPRMFEAGRENTVLFTSALMSAERRRDASEWTMVFVCGEERVDPFQMGEVLTAELGVGRAVCLGGPSLNATMIEARAVDELFMTVAPKLQGGRGMATLMEGSGFPTDALPGMHLMSVYTDASELFLRYRFGPDE